LTSGSSSEWYLSDRLGSIRGIADSSGQVTTEYDYDPFGTPEGTSVPQDYGFTGEPQDASTSLVQLRSRWYNPAAARFLTRDLFFGHLGAPLSLHRYSYVGLDPVNFVDPAGRDRYEAEIDGEDPDARIAS
jgi:RHS repeat-associated protein